MKNKVVTNINIYCLLFQYASSQYNPQAYEEIQQGYQYPYQNIAYQQYSSQNSYKNFDNNKWMQENYEDYNDYVRETCACDKCDEIMRKPSCRVVCPNCFVTPSPVMAPSYVFLPFPYPFPTAPNTTHSPVTGTVETTTISTTITTEARTENKTEETKTVKALTPETVTLSNALPEENNDVLKDKSPFNIKDKDQYSITSIRRTKPHWLPKYGIVPISDKVAEKLMLQLRSMRVIHPQKDNIRNVDEISSPY